MTMMVRTLKREGEEGKQKQNLLNRQYKNLELNWDYILKQVHIKLLMVTLTHTITSILVSHQRLKVGTILQLQFLLSLTKTNIQQVDLHLLLHIHINSQTFIINQGHQRDITVLTIAAFIHLKHNSFLEFLVTTLNRIIMVHHITQTTTKSQLLQQNRKSTFVIT